MNYIRGAISTISAPYQYYKDLPPINPSTLTGAIDVIVLQRPTSNGDSELACSPFHVRFGKWQVLRPGEKKVNVFVNGNPIPFNMKIGEAGEAFFVFETEDDIPDDLITSPLLEATRTADKEVPSGRFGAKQEKDHDKDEETKAKVPEETQEPDFLDLDAAPKDQVSTPPSEEKLSQGHVSEPIDSLSSSPLSPMLSGVTPSSLLARAGTTMDPHQKADIYLQPRQSEVHTPEVSYKHDVALDLEGYHIDKPPRKAAYTPSVHEERAEVEYPTVSASRPPSPSRTPQPFNTLPSLRSRSSQHPEPTDLILKIPQPTLRATSEPPPNHEEQQSPDTRDSCSIMPVQEYSWEWGAFPQPSPMKTSFGKGRFDSMKGKGKTRLDPLDSEDDMLLPMDIDEEAPEIGFMRSQSVPPELDGSPTTKRRELPAQDIPVEESDNDLGSFGAGGRLTSSRHNPTQFGVHIEGKNATFELSIVNSDESKGGNRKVFDGRDEVEAARLFDKGKVDYRKFLDDESVVRDKRLVLKWAGGQYIIRDDASPLMDALVLWRTTALQSHPTDLPSRGPSPAPQSEDEPLSSSDERDEIKRSNSDPVDLSRKPTSSSWSRWWSRSRSNREVDASDKANRPELRETASDTPVSRGTQTKILRTKQTPSLRIPFPSASAPPSTPVVQPKLETLEVTALEGLESGRGQGKKFAKTLRLTSDQLKSLNLKPGANTITFSLSTSGVIACTARIFVWDSTDLVVVSDIDGTITKSDGLGHVFAMIGRDWTHIGVAKLYTDITRNGYKVMYLTSRAIGQADATRDYLKGIKQNNYQLPEGPVIMSPDRLMASLHREVIMRKPEVFKMACLRDIQRLFGDGSRNPFYAGFGNRITDALSYRSVNVPSARIFTIDSTGEVKMELLELAGYKSSYIHMTDLVDQMFPPIHRKWAPEFTDFNYWKTPVQDFTLPDLSPPSPALSARSDTSNQSALARLRNFSLVGNRQSNHMKQYSQPTPGTDSSTPNPAMSNNKNAHLRQMSSLERLSNTLATLTQSSSSSVGESRRSLSPASRSSLSLTYAESWSDEEYGDDGFDNGGERKGRRRSRTRSEISMPGSLDEMRFGQDDDEHLDDVDIEEGYGYEGESEDGPENEEEAAEEAFDEDFFATGEMKNVPFL
ncbi:hypothetical protein PILCRDRAFT_811742 [Piloderma croceum F 1598]|uniref:phosphatidate phosphatase n=1 Tax=Piloderma croceum (strain F 1598) TaxID=765440 RepID=A0A0C3G4Q4_PILCF|nr:hypothetical protein PILCRDRAFT_811742 [Piloderma croceum F 1598]